MSGDSVLVHLIIEKEQVELEISQLQGQKNNLEELEYFKRLEELFVRLAKLNDQIERKKEEN